MSAMTALLVREAVDARLRQEEMVRREFELPVGRWIDTAVLAPASTPPEPPAPDAGPFPPSNRKP